MRRAALVALLLSACAAPTGAEVEVCDGSWRDVESRIVTPGGEPSQVIPIECMRRIGERRVRIGFRMPPGPRCHRLTAVEVVEAADAVSITLVVSRDDQPQAGACAEESVRTTTEIDLQALIADRVLLDGSRGE